MPVTYLLTYLFVVVDEQPVPLPQPVEAKSADVIAGIAISACCIGAVVIVVIDIASLKASAAHLIQNIHTISSP